MIYRLTRTVSIDECPWFAVMGVEELPAGMLLYPADDKWNVCSTGLAVSFHEGGPYFEVPADAVRKTVKPLVAFSVN